MVLQIARLIAVLALLCVAAALATPQGRLPLALRGVAKLFKMASHEQRVPVWKRLLSFGLVSLAIVLTFL